jgi:Ser/Thr protein kinase RdoA (MazF antagonist)
MTACRPRANPVWQIGPVLAHLTEVLGFHPGKFQVVRSGHNLTFALPEAGFFVRVGEPGSEQQARQALSFGRTFGARGVPVLRPDDRLHEPLQTNQGPVTLWPLLHGHTAESEGVASIACWAWMGQALGELHRSPALVDFRSAVTSRRTLHERCAVLERADVFSPSRMRQVRALAERVAHLSDRMQRASPVVPVHGDPYPSNIMVVDGEPILIDLDNSGLGAAAMDLAVPLVLHRRFGLPHRTVEAFFDGYGVDEGRIPNLEAAVRLRELGTVTYLFALAAHSPVYAHELADRLDSLEESTCWTTLPELAARSIGRDDVDA